MKRRRRMKPTQATTTGERRVLRGLIYASAIVTIFFIAYVWWGKARACTNMCHATGAIAGVLKFNSGGRLNLGTACECVAAPKNP